MTAFTVELTSVAEDQLTESWLRAVDRHAITVAQAAIDDLLACDPWYEGPVFQKVLISESFVL